MEKINPTYILTGEFRESRYKCTECKDTGLSVATEEQLADPNSKLLVDHKTELVEGKYVDTEILKTICRCQHTLNSVRNFRKSNIENDAKKFTFPKYETDTDYRKYIKDKATKFANNPRQMFALLGQSGLGKTHICTAITLHFLRKGMQAERYIWTDLVDDARANYYAFDDDLMFHLKTVRVLYIDDFMKTKDNHGEIQDFVFNAAFSIINKRKEDPELITIITTELSLEDLLSIDVAIAGRIKEMSGEFLIDVTYKNDGNYRMKI